MQLGNTFQGKKCARCHKRSRAIRLLPMTSGIIAPVSKRANERCNAQELAARFNWGRRTPAPRRRWEAQHRPERVPVPSRVIF